LRGWKDCGFRWDGVRAAGGARPYPTPLGGRRRIWKAAGSPRWSDSPLDRLARCRPGFALSFGWQELRLPAMRAAWTGALAAVAARVVEGDLDARAVEEAILQSLLFVGYPAALEGMQGWRRVSGTLPPPTADPRGREAWSMQGAHLLGQVYGSQASVVRERMRAMHPDLGAWMLEEGYGKVLSRPGLPIGERELVNCALLAVQDAPRQLYSHLRGALHVGESVERIADVLAEVDPWIPGAEARARVYETWARVQEAWMRHAHRASDDEGQGRGIDVC
jgi:4-carboxymuconolactone decarboxylase